jgi:hypothetical protein
MPRKLTSPILSRKPSLTRFIFAFIAGFFSVLIFHQGMLALLHAVSFIAISPFPTQPTRPFGVPQIWSLAFWGGIWGIVFALFDWRFPQGVGYWLLTLLFGAIGPTLVAWFVVFPLKGLPLGGGWKPAAMATGLMINAAWGLGTAFFLQSLTMWRSVGHPGSSSSSRGRGAP